MKKCPFCAEEIQDEAILCKHCGKNFKEEEKQKKIQESNRRFISGCFTTMIIFVSLIVGCVAFYGSNPPQSIKPDNVEVYVMAESAVEKRLKAPGTAKFCGYSQAKVINYEPKKYTILGYVDSENSFGAKIRTQFEVSLQWLGNDQWKIIHVELN